MEIKMLNRFASLRFSSLCFAFLLCFNASAYAQSMSITLSEDSAQMGYGFLVGGGDFGRTELKASFLYNTNDTYLFDAGLHVFDEVGSKVKGLVAGVGGKIYGGTIEDNAQSHQILVLGVGGQLRYSIPQNPRFILGVEGYYAPPIVSFWDAGKFYETAVRVEYEILPKASAYLEYTYYYLDSTKEGTKQPGSFEDGVRVGMELNF